MSDLPHQPPNSYRVTLVLAWPRPRLDQALLEALRSQNQIMALRNISRTEFKELFKNKRIQIKGQSARPSSALAKGTTYVDILGFSPLAE